MNEAYLYYISIWRPINGLSIGSVFTSKCARLTKEDVEKCLDQNAKVFRRFSANDPMIQITKSNIDRYHTAKLLNDDEFKQHQIEEAAAGAKEVSVDPLANVEKEESNKVEISGYIAPVDIELPPKGEISTSSNEEDPENEEDQIETVELEPVEITEEEVVTEESNENSIEDTEVTEETVDLEEDDQEDTKSDDFVDTNVIIDGNTSRKKKKNRR